MKRLLLALLALVVTSGLVIAVLVARNAGSGPLAPTERCTATVAGHTVVLDPEQARNATLIAAIGVRRGLPARAVSIALAAAYQESKIHNISHGDRDSLGLFQQRPSQGWGTRAQIMDPYHAINAFYDGLAKVPRYRELRITEAAQRVQRSAYPEAYEQHAEDARALASALTGYSPEGALSCVWHDDHEASSTELDARGLTARAAAVRAELRRAFGEVPLGGFAAGGVSSGHMPGSAHYSGRAVDAFVRPMTRANNRLGWAIAQYLVAHADRLAVAHVIFDAKIWAVGLRSGQGWRDYQVPSGSGGNRDVLLHRDHVHVDVVA